MEAIPSASMTHRGFVWRTEQKVRASKGISLLQTAINGFIRNTATGNMQTVVRKNARLDLRKACLLPPTKKGRHKTLQENPVIAFLCYQIHHVIRSNLAVPVSQHRQGYGGNISVGESLPDSRRCPYRTAAFPQSVSRSAFPTHHDNQTSCLVAAPERRRDENCQAR